MVRGLAKTEDILDSLEHPSWDRIFKIKDAIDLGVPIQYYS
jgi:carbamoyl-phosphate synthase large subunit